MKSDIYTKFILTIIATCLVVIVIRDVPLIKTAQAYGDQSVRIESVSSYAFQYAGPLHVICDSGCTR
ncbi:MAG: hypothetical protein KGI13_08765 [Betaproteobacteria bacterium]|nr:hypothetical protein [Betaproteobacteria bacterium]